MALYRQIFIDFWRDPKVTEEMSAEDRYVLLYLLTNPSTTQIGIYMITKRQMAFDLGYSTESVGAILNRFEHGLGLIRYNPDDYRIAIPTGIGKIDEALEGGLGKGELGVIIGSSSFGKTSLTTSLAAHAATHRCEANNNQGFKVLQIVFEDRIKQIQRKHLGKITGVEAKDLSKEDIVGAVKEQLSHYEDKEMLKKNLRIKRFPSGEITASFLRRFLNKLINSGFKPDMVIVDYFECLEHLGDSASAISKSPANASNFRIVLPSFSYSLALALSPKCSKHSK